jgi:hypothetical protein
MAINSQPYGGRPPCVHCGFCHGFACEVMAKASTLTTVIPQGEATDAAKCVPTVTSRGSKPTSRDARQASRTDGRAPCSAYSRAGRGCRSNGLDDQSLESLRSHRSLGSPSHSGQSRRAVGVAIARPSEQCRHDPPDADRRLGAPARLSGAISGLSVSTASDPTRAARVTGYSTRSPGQPCLQRIES